MQELACWNAVCSSPLASSCLRLSKAEETWLPIVATVVPTVAAAAASSLMLEALSTAVAIESASALRSLESWSTKSFACCPTCVSGLPRSFKSDSSVSVADFASSAALCNESFERLPPLSESPADVIELFQVEMAEQTPFAQSAVEVDWELLLEPQPAARSAKASTRATGIRRTEQGP